MNKFRYRIRQRLATEFMRIGIYRDDSYDIVDKIMLSTIHTTDTERERVLNIILLKLKETII